MSPSPSPTEISGDEVDPSFPAPIRHIDEIEAIFAELARRLPHLILKSADLFSDQLAALDRLYSLFEEATEDVYRQQSFLQYNESFTGHASIHDPSSFFALILRPPHFSILMQILDLGREEDAPDVTFLSDKSTIARLRIQMQVRVLEILGILIEGHVEHCPNSPIELEEGLFRPFSFPFNLQISLFSGLALGLSESVLKYRSLLAATFAPDPEEEGKAPDAAPKSFEAFLELDAKRRTLALPSTRSAEIERASHCDLTSSLSLLSCICDFITKLSLHLLDLTRDAAVNSGLVQTICDLLSSDDDKSHLPIEPLVMRQAATVLRALTFNDRRKRVKSIAAESGALQGLIRMMGSGCSDQMQHVSLCAIGNLVHSSGAIKQQVLDEGGLQPIISLLKSRNPESRKEAALVLGQLANGIVANGETWKVRIAQRAAIPALVGILHNDSGQHGSPSLEFATFALGRLCHESENRIGAVEAGAVPCLMSLVESPVSVLQHNATFALYALVDQTEQMAQILADGLIGCLLSSALESSQARDCAHRCIVRIHNHLRDFPRIREEIDFVLAGGSKDLRGGQRLARDLVHVLQESLLPSFYLQQGGLQALFSILLNRGSATPSPSSPAPLDSTVANDSESEGEGDLEADESHQAGSDRDVAFASLDEAPRPPLVLPDAVAAAARHPQDVRDLIVALRCILKRALGCIHRLRDVSPRAVQLLEPPVETEPQLQPNDAGLAPPQVRAEGDNTSAVTEAQAPPPAPVRRGLAPLDMNVVAGRGPVAGSKRTREGEVTGNRLSVSASGKPSSAPQAPKAPPSQPPMQRSADNLAFLNLAEGSDVRFLVEGRTFYAHRSLLTYTSDYFRAMFTGPFADAAQRVVDISLPEHIRLSALETVMRFLYTGHAHVVLEEAQQVLELANMYLLTDLNAACGDRLAEGLSHETLRDLYELARAYHCKTLSEHCAAYLVLHGEEIIEDWEVYGIQKHGRKRSGSLGESDPALSDGPAAAGLMMDDAASDSDGDEVEWRGHGGQRSSTGLKRGAVIVPARKEKEKGLLMEPATHPQLPASAAPSAPEVTEFERAVIELTDIAQGLLPSLYELVSSILRLTAQVIEEAPEQVRDRNLDLVHVPSMRAMVRGPRKAGRVPDHLPTSVFGINLNALSRPGLMGDELPRLANQPDARRILGLLLLEKHARVTHLGQRRDRGPPPRPVALEDEDEDSEGEFEEEDFREVIFI